MWTDDDRKWLYSKMQAAGIDTGSEKDFENSMEDDADSKWYYDKSIELGLDVGDYQKDFLPMMRKSIEGGSPAPGSGGSGGSSSSSSSGGSNGSNVQTGNPVVGDAREKQDAAAERRRNGNYLNRTFSALRGLSGEIGDALEKSGPGAAAAAASNVPAESDAQTQPTVETAGQGDVKTADSPKVTDSLRVDSSGALLPQGIQGKGMFDLSEYDNQSWFINGIQFNSTAEARRYVEEHPELRYNFKDKEGKQYKSFDELVQHVKDKSKAAFDEKKPKSGEFLTEQGREMAAEADGENSEYAVNNGVQENMGASSAAGDASSDDEKTQISTKRYKAGTPESQREATDLAVGARKAYEHAIGLATAPNAAGDEMYSTALDYITSGVVEDQDRERRKIRSEYDKLHFNDFARENMQVFFDMEDKAQKEAYRQMEQYSRNAPNTSYSSIGRGTQMAAISLRETDPQKISSDVVTSLDSRGALTNYLLGRMGLKASEVPKDYNPLGGGGDTLTGAEMNALTQLMYKEHGEIADKIQQEIYDYYKRKDAPDSDLEYILSSAVHDNLMATLAKAMAHRAANDSGIREQLRQMAFSEYGDNAGFFTNVAATAAPYVVDMALGAFKIPAMAGEATTGAVLKGLVKEGTKRLVARGATNAAAKKAVTGAAKRWLATEHPYWNMALNALGSGVNFATYEAQNELVRQYNDGQFSLGSLLGKGAKGFLLGGATGFTGGFFGKMGENMRGWHRLGVDVAGFGSEVTIFATSDAAMQAMEGEDVNWGKAFGRSLAMVTGFKAVGGIGTIFKSPEAIYKRYAGAKDLDYKLTDADKTALSGLGYDFSTKEGLNKAIGELAPVEKTNADGTKTVDRSNYDRVMQDNSGNVDILTKRKVNRLLTGSDLIHWTGGKDYYPFNAWRTENEDGTITIQTFDADGNINGIAEYRSSWSAAKDYRDVLDMCRFYNLNGIRAFLGNAGADVTIERDAFERTRKQFADEDVSELEALLSLKKPQEEWTDRDREILDAHLQNVHDVFGEQLKDYQAKQAAAAYDGATKYEESMRAAQEQATRLLTGGTGAEGGGGVPPAEGGDGPVEQTPADKARADYERLMADVENRKRVAESGVREVFGDDVMDYLTKGEGAPGFDPIFLLRQALVSGESDENIAKITDYINAWYADKGVRDGVNGAVRSEVEQSDAEIDGAANRQSGHVLGAVMKVDDRRVFVVDGEVVLNDDGTIDREKSSESIIVKDAATGKVEVVDPRDVLEVVDGGDAAELKEAARKDIEAKAAGLLIDGNNGNDGSNGANGLNGLNGENDGAGEQPTGNGESEDAMPMIGEGDDAEPDFMQTSPERGFRYIYDESGWDQEEGDAFVEANLAEAKKQLNAATKKKPKMGTSMSKYNKEKRDYEGKVQAAQQVVDYWGGVKQARDQRAGEELRRRAEEEARRQDEERNRQEQARLEEQRRQEEEQRKQQEAEELGSHTVGKEIRDRWTGAPKVEGNADELTLADGTRIAGRYVLVESGAATPSHNAGGGFVKNAGFPVDENGGTVNDRDYERDTRAQAITREMGRTYDGRALQSVPVVSRDGVVLSGNGRTMAGEIAAADGTDGAYIENLSKYGGKFGFTPEQVAGMQHPRVVFVPDEALPYDAETFARFNAQEMKGQNKTETAVKLGKIVPDDVYNRVIRGINGFESISDFFSDDKATAEVVNELRGAGVINEMQYGEMFDGGRLSGTGRELIENVLIGKAFEGSPDAVRMLTEYPAMRQKAVSALTAIGNNRRLGGDYTLEHEIGQAIELAYRALKSGAYKHGDRVSDFARQQNLFEFDEGSTVADYQNMMVMLLADVLNGKEVNKLRNVLELYNAHAAESAAGQTDMFSGGAVRTKEEILNDVYNLLGYGTRKEIEQQRSGARETVRAQLDGESPGKPSGGNEGAEPSGTAGAVGSGSGSEGGLTLTGDEGGASPAIDAGHEALPTSAVENQTGSATQGGTEPEQQSAEKGYTVEQTTYTNKKGKTSDVWFVKFDGELTKEQLSAGKELAKEPLPGRKTSKGWWDREKGGFLMRSEEAANEIGEKLGNAEAVKDAQPLGLKDVQAATVKGGSGKPVPGSEINGTETAPVAAADANKPQLPNYDYDLEDSVYDETLTGLRDALNNREPGSVPNIESIEREIRVLRKRAKNVEVGIPTASAETLPQAFEALANFNGRRKAYEQFLSDIRNRMKETERDEALSAHGVKLGDKVIYKGEEATIHDADHGHVTLDTGMSPVIYESVEWGNVELPKRDSTDHQPNRVNVEGLLGALKENGTAKLSDHTEDADKTQETGSTNAEGEEAPRQEKKKSKWVDDEDADRFEELRRRMREKLDELNRQRGAGVDPEMFAIGAEMAFYMIKHGLHKFADFAREMIEAVGDGIRPYLKSLYEGARNFPEMEDYLDKMTPYEDVRKFDVKNFDKEGPKDIVGTAEQIVLEEQAAKEAESAVEKLTDRRNAERRDEENGVVRAQDGTPLRKAVEADFDGERPVVYVDGEPKHVFMVQRSGEQTSGATFSAPVIDYIHTTDGKQHRLDEVMVEDDRAIRETVARYRNTIVDRMKTDPVVINTVKKNNETTYIPALSFMVKSDYLYGSLGDIDNPEYISFIKAIDKDVDGFIRGTVDAVVAAVRGNAGGIDMSKTRPMTYEQDVWGGNADTDKPTIVYYDGKLYELGQISTDGKVDVDGVERVKGRGYLQDMETGERLPEAVPLEDLLVYDETLGKKSVKKPLKSGKKSVTSQKEGEGSPAVTGAVQLDLFAEAEQDSSDIRTNDAPPHRPVEELTGDSGSHQETARQEHDFVGDVAEAIINKATEALQGGNPEPLTMRDVTGMLSGYPALSDYSKTDLQELVELAMTKVTRASAGHYIDGDAKSQRLGYDRIVAQYMAQPLLNARDSTRIERQQYSTPTPFGYVMGQFLRAGRKVDSVLEPSAGNGALTITFDPKIVHVNDIDERRLSNLRTLGYGKVTTQNGLLPFAIDQVDAIATNPPFGTVSPRSYDNGLFNITSLEGQMAINALESMKDDGRAAIIIGGNTEYRSNGVMKPKDMAFFSYLYSHYNVADVINLDGSMYGRNGTKFPVRMILIDGRRAKEGEVTRETRVVPPVESKARAEQVHTFDELYNRIQDDLLQLSQNAHKPAGSDGQASGVVAGTGAQKPAVVNRPASGGRPSSSLSGGGVDGGGGSQQPGNTSPSGKPGIGGKPTNEVRPSGLGNEHGSHGGGIGNHVRTGTPGGTSGRPVRNGTASMGGTDVPQNGGGRVPGVSEHGNIAPSPAVSGKRLSIGDEKVGYPNRSESGTLMSVVPANQADAISKSLGEIGDVDAFLVDQLGYSSKEELFGCLAAEQIDSVALAITQMNRGKGFIIGDMTGVGKGRQGASLIRYGVRQGKIPIYFTQKASLFSDNYRDLSDIGSGELRPFIIGSSTEANITDALGKVVHRLPSKKEQERVFDYISKHGRLPEEYDYVITTYSQIQTGTMDYEAQGDGSISPKARDSEKVNSAARSGQRKRDALSQLAPNGIAILDESHTVGGTGGGAMFMQYMLQGVQGVTFLSATFAKRADNMPIYAMKTDINESGLDPKDLIAAIQRGGVTLQEIMSKQLVESGQMIRRERSFQGVTIDWMPVSDEQSEVQHRQFDEVSSIFAAIRSFQEDYVKPAIEQLSDSIADVGSSADITRGTESLGVRNVPFASKMYNLVNQLLFSLKADAVADRVIWNLEHGFKPVISFTNTMEGFLGELPKDTPMDDLPDFSLTLLRALDGVMRFTTTDMDNKNEGGMLRPSDLGPEGESVYNEIRNRILTLSSGLPISPMDYIRMKLESAGYRVGEITGRQTELAKTDDGRYVVRNRSERDKKVAARGFNDGSIDVLMVNKSGSTGISLHSSTKFSDQRQRVMVFAQFQSDINDEVQMRGRVDRTGQVSRGKYEYIVSTIPAEQRLQMMFKSKLKSLDANTTSSQKSKFNEMEVVDFLNKYGDEVVWQYMSEHPELEEKLGDPLNMLSNSGDDDGNTNTGNVRGKGENLAMNGCAAKIARYLPFLPVREQEVVFREITEAYAVKMQLLNDAGENDLEITTMPLRAETKGRKIWRKGENPGSGNAFADNVYVEQVEVDVLRKPMKLDEVNTLSSKMSGGKPWKDWIEEKRNAINAYFDEKTSGVVDRMQKAAEARAEKARQKYIQSAKRYRELGRNEFTDAEIEQMAETSYNEVMRDAEMKIERQRNQLATRRRALIKLTRDFEPSKPLIIPQNMNDASQTSFNPTIGTFIGFKFNRDFSLGSSTAVFATLDGRRKVELPLSDSQALGIISTQSVMQSSTLRRFSMDDWDSKVPTSTRKTSYIITGNLLQALVDIQRNENSARGTLVTYSTIDGDVRQGILMPDNFRETDLRQDVPINQLEQEIRAGNSAVSADGDVEVMNYGRYGFRISVPRSTSRGGKYFSDRELRRLVDRGEFETRGNSMVGIVSEDNLKAVLDLLTNKFGVTVRRTSELHDADDLHFSDGDDDGSHIVGDYIKTDMPGYDLSPTSPGNKTADELIADWMPDAGQMQQYEGLTEKELSGILTKTSLYGRMSKSPVQAVLGAPYYYDLRQNAFTTHGAVYYGRFNNRGKKDGLHVSLWADGWPKEVGTYKNGRKDGVFTEWNEDWTRTSYTEYKNGRATGWAVDWRADGSVRMLSHFEGGKVDEAYTFDEDGKVVEGVRTVDGEKQRVRREYVEERGFGERGSEWKYEYETGDDMTDAERRAREVVAELNEKGVDVENSGDYDLHFSMREEPAPKVTKKGYAVYVVKRDRKTGRVVKLVPKMLSNDPGAPPLTWLNADTGWLKRDENGQPLQNTLGRGMVSVNGNQSGGKSSNKLSWRPGKHLAAYPNASQFATKNGEIPEDVVFFEVEYAADPELHKEYQLSSWEHGMKENGDYDNTLGGIPYIPRDSYYVYRTNAIADGATPMIITGAYKINRALTDAEAKELNEQNGGLWFPRRGGELTADGLKKMGLDEAGLSRMRDEFDYDTIADGHDESDDARALPGYVRRPLDFNNEKLRHAAEENAKVMGDDGVALDDYSKGYVLPDERGESGKGDSRSDVRSAIEDTASGLGEDVEIVDDVSTLTHKNKQLEARMRKAKGMFNARTGKVTLVLPNLLTAEDAVGTVLHEVVGHKGLRELFGDDFDVFLDNVYNNVEDDIRERIDGLNKKKETEKDRRDATEEYLSRLTEGKEYEELVKRGVWQKIKDWFMDLLRKAGVKLKRQLNDNDLRYILWRSHERMKERAARKSSKMGADPLTEARDAAMRDELGIDKERQEGEKHFSDGEDVEGVAEDADYEAAREELNVYDAGRMTFEDAITDGLTKLSAKNKEDKKLRVEAVMAIGGNLSKILQGMSRQREYDRQTVDDIVRLARTVIGNGMFRNFTPYQVGRLLGMVKRATGREDITKEADKVVDLLMDCQLKELESLLDRQLRTKGKKTDDRGVEIQGALDVKGQRMLDAMRTAIRIATKKGETELDDRMSDCLDRMGSDDDVTRQNAGQEYAGLLLAKEYMDNIAKSEAEEDSLYDEIRQADEERRARKASGDSQADKDFREFKRETEAAIRENRLERMGAYGELITKLGGKLGESAQRAQDWLEQDKERAREIQHNANSDLEGVSASEFSRETWKQRAANWAPVRFFMKPLGTFDMMLRFFGSKSVDGRGYLWNRFMTGWVEANDKEWRNLRAAHDQLDEKVSEVFGKKMRWSDLLSMERKMDGVEVEFWDAGEKKKHTLTQGNMLYIYAVNKMSDGRMKLRKMGITEEDVERITKKIDPRFIAIADWVQDEFLKSKRKDYNAVHLRLTGADMADIDNYFPLKVNKRSLSKEEEIGNSQEGEQKPATKSVSWIKRTKNSRPLDIVNADFFDVLLEHLQDNEHIAAFGELNRDINTLLSYKRFRNKVLNMSSLRYGSGKNLWNNFRKVCEIAGGVYTPKVDRDSVDTTVVNIAKGVTMGKISFRLYTAFKQLTSSPAFATEASPIAFAKNNPFTGGWQAWKWAIENLPGFSKRWQSRQAGDSRLVDTDSDWKFWHRKFVKTMSRWGMTPNALIDALTVACGAKAIYETKYKKYKKMGYPDAKAHRLALRDASVSVNETQQSSEEAYLSAMQLDRTAASTALTVFRNASMGYERRYADAMSNFVRKLKPGYKDMSIAFMKKQLMRDGLSEDDADKAANQAYRRSWWKDVANMAMFGHIMQIAWNLAPYLPFLFLIGGDDDKKKEMAEDALMHSLAGPIEGLSLGAQGSELLNMGRHILDDDENVWKATKKQLKNYQFNLLPLMSDLQSMFRHFASDQVQGFNDVINLIVQSGIGVNPQTITDMAAAILDRCDGDPDLSREATIMWLRIANAPQTQLDQIYLEELGLKGSDAKKLSAGELAERYVRYKTKRTAPLTGWMYSDEDEQKAKDRYMDRFVKMMDERIGGLDDKEMQRAFDEGDALLRKEVGKAAAKKQGSQDYYGSPTTVYGEIYKQHRNYFDLSEDVLLQTEAKKAKDSGDMDRYKEIDSGRRAITKIKKDLDGAPYTLQDGSVITVDDIMNEIREERMKLLEELGL